MTHLTKKQLELKTESTTGEEEIFFIKGLL